MLDCKAKAFIEESHKVHGVSYDYSLVSFDKKSDKVAILCKQHGIFQQRVSHHLRGNGCPSCHLETKRKSINTFIEQARILYGNIYNYSKVVYKNTHTKVNIICGKHGEFWQTPKKHLEGIGCKGCIRERDQTKRKENFLTKAKEKHGNKYDYSKVHYEGINKKVNIVCPKHGLFQQTPNLHLQAHGCYDCGKEFASKTNKNNSGDRFLSFSTSLYQGKYDYSLVKYEGKDNRVIIICPVHGSFKQTPVQHLKGIGCPKCALYDNKTPTDYFIHSAKKVHGDKYNYSKVFYESSSSKVEIICPEHGSFIQEARNHSSLAAGCPKCGVLKSKAENTVITHVRELGFESIQSDRSLIKPLELDIVIPDKKIAIEYNGLRWHSEKFGKDKHYHKNKTDLCKAQGYRLIHIWEDDFNKDPQKELDFISHALGVSSQDKVFARKTTIRQIDNKIGRDFLDNYHIQGSGTGSIYYGTYFNDILTAVTSFLIRKDSVELTRHSSDRQVVGGLGKVTKFASKELKKDIISFCDLSRFNGSSYLSCGYEVEKEIPPDYKYLVGSKREHKFIWRKKNIKRKLPDIYSDELTEKQMMELAEIPRIWDCGKLRLIYRYDDTSSNKSN